MPPYSPTYTTVIAHGDFGPWIEKLILELPCEIGVNDIDSATFNVFCARHEFTDGSILMRKEKGSDHAAPSQGYVNVRAAYPCDASGIRTARGTHAALELPECRLTKTVEGSVLHARFVENRFRVTQTAELPAAPDPISGLVFCERAAAIAPALAGWTNAQASEPVNGICLKYGYYTPSFEDMPAPADDPLAKSAERPGKAPLIIWLHGAGEGGEEPELAYTGNRVTVLSQPHIQGLLGGAAWVLVPQSPTFWMDDGEEQLGRSNISIYTEPLKALIDEFVAAHAEQIDTERIIIGGLSNGGFMTVRMCADYPGFFAAGLPVCAPFYIENQTPEMIDALVRTPLWFVHAKGDELVDPRETSLPLYHALREAGATVRMTYFDHVEDLTGRYREADGTPKRIFSHGVWVHVYNDFCRTDLDGTNVLLDGEPVGLWEWAAAQRHRA